MHKIVKAFYNELINLLYLAIGLVIVNILVWSLTYEADEDGKPMIMESTETVIGIKSVMDIDLLSVAVRNMLCILCMAYYRMNVFHEEMYYKSNEMYMSFLLDLYVKLFMIYLLVLYVAVAALIRQSVCYSIKVAYVVSLYVTCVLQREVCLYVNKCLMDKTQVLKWEILLTLSRMWYAMSPLKPLANMIAGVDFGLKVSYRYSVRLELLEVIVVFMTIYAANAVARFTEMLKLMSSMMQVFKSCVSRWNSGKQGYRSHIYYNKRGMEVGFQTYLSTSAAPFCTGHNCLCTNIKSRFFSEDKKRYELFISKVNEQDSLVMQLRPVPQFIDTEVEVINSVSESITSSKEMLDCVRISVTTILKYVYIKDEKLSFYCFDIIVNTGKTSQITCSYSFYGINMNYITVNHKYPRVGRLVNRQDGKLKLDLSYQLQITLFLLNACVRQVIINVEIKLLNGFKKFTRVIESSLSGSSFLMKFNNIIYDDINVDLKSVKVRVI